MSLPVELLCYTVVVSFCDLGPDSVPSLSKNENKVFAKERGCFHQ